ncbi:hypothetical protein BJ944DRAFT_257157 [Cunninghamella echinulata]|nr:hypothetical protein BJ944DRAFT_257157 [Cunninghamella echinulata]
MKDPSVPSDDTIQEFPSEDTIDHHPQRASDYRLQHYKIHLSHKIQASSFQPIRDNEWVINDSFCISDACYQFRNNTAKLLDNPGSFSDLRLLAINHIYLFDKIKDQSVTKYFGDSIHQAFFKQLSLDKYIPEKGKKAFDWCTDLANSPPDNWNTCLSTTATMLLEATESRNLIDTHTSHVLIQILPSFISGPPLSRIEDTLIHHYIAPILQSIFTSDNRFDIEWANSELNSKDSVIYKPDFIVSCFTNRYKILVGEIKAPNSSSTIESDLIKLGKQMKILYNQLVDKHIPDPIACGILIKGFNLSTYMLDLKSPNLYRLINISHITLFQSIDEIYKLPMILSRLLQLKNIITTTTEKTETFAINKFNNSSSLPKFQPPLSWLSNDIYLLSRKRKHSGSS